MAGRYGMSFAAKLNEEGRYDEAIAEATKLFEKAPTSPLPLVDRATAYELLERFDDAVADYERAFALDREAEVLETGVVDDSYFNALMSAATEHAKRDKAVASRLLDRYAATLPDGEHLDEIAEWRARLTD